MKNSKKSNLIHVFWGFIIFLLIFPVGCAKKEVQKDLKVGVVLPLSGDLSDYGQQTLKGMELALQEINQAGGAKGAQIKFITQDTQGDLMKTISVTRQLMDQGVIAIIGENVSSNSTAIAHLAQEAKIPMITPSATGMTVTRGMDYAFRVCFNDENQARALAEYTVKELNAKTAVILSEEESFYSLGLDHFFEEHFERLGGKLERDIHYTPGEKEFKNAFQEIKKINPDIIFLPTYYTTVTNILDAARSAGIKSTFIGGDGWDSPKLLHVKAATGSYFSTHFFSGDSDPYIQDFVSTYRAKYNEYPQAMAGLGYDTVRFLKKALDNSTDFTGEGIQKAIKELKQFSGVTGSMTMSPDGKTKKGMVILKITDGSLSLAKKLQPTE